MTTEDLSVLGFSEGRPASRLRNLLPTHLRHQAKPRVPHQPASCPVHGDIHCGNVHRCSVPVDQAEPQNRKPREEKGGGGKSRSPSLLQGSLMSPACESQSVLP